jgi:hypothetical protein
MLLPLKTEEFHDPAKILKFFRKIHLKGSNPKHLPIANRIRNLTIKHFKYAF